MKWLSDEQRSHRVAGILIFVHGAHLMLGTRRAHSLAYELNFPGIDQLFVLFPDHGAFSRYKGSVEDRLGLAADHILYINKTRVGDQIKQEQKLNYELSEGGTGEKTFFDKGSHVLVIDDFTNSGSTLFGAVTLVRSLLRSSGGLMGLSEKEQIEGCFAA
ncbi:unnamed protein product [Symbiodinium microadriaticum]|nr:unnamed protein product [Symbiodinium microadriaticum]